MKSSRIRPLQFDELEARDVPSQTLQPVLLVLSDHDDIRYGRVAMNQSLATSQDAGATASQKLQPVLLVLGDSDAARFGN